MKNIRVKKMLSILLVAVITISSININKTNANELVSDKYADIVGLYKTVDETIQLLIERADNDELGERTYFVKSEEETLDTSWWYNIVDRRCGENIYLAFRNNDCVYTFKSGDYYYHTLRIDTYRAYTTSEDKKEYEEKVRYVEENLGLFSDEMCDYEKAAIIFKYIVDNVEYGGYGTSIYKGQTAYEALLNGESVCAGYSRLYASMLTDVGINNIWITSRELETSHAWNLVRMGDMWYYCDPTYSTSVASVDEYVYLPSFMRGSIEDAEAPQHEVDTLSYNAINYYNGIVSEETMRFGDDGKGSSRVSLSRIYNYTAPTCTETGYYDIGCDYCNDRHEITIPVTHYYTHTITKEANCCEDGSGVTTCTLCNDSYEYTIPMKEHKWTYASQIADCETDGYEKVYCEDCETNYWIEETKAYIHDWSEWEESSSISYKRTCSKCGDVEVEYKSVIDGTGETTTESAITEEDKTPMDRGYGIVAYYDESLGYWVYEDVIFGAVYVDGETGVWVESLGEYVIWNEVTHQFERIGEVSTTTEKETETPATTPGTTTAYNPVTTIEKSTSDIEKEETTTINKEVSSSQEEVTTIVNKPKKVKIHSLKNKKKKSVKMVWKNAKYAKKYQIQYSLSKKFKKGKKYQTKTRTTKKLTLKIKKLKINKTYYFRVRGVNGKVYGKWSAKKKVKIRK